MKTRFELHKTLTSLIFILSLSGALAACSQGEKPSDQTRAANEIDATPQPKLFEKGNGSRTHLSEQEKALLAQGHKLPKLSLDNRRDLLRRLDFEISRATRDENFNKARLYAETALEVKTSISLENPNSFHGKIGIILGSNEFGNIERAEGNAERARDIYLASLESLKNTPPPPESKSLWLQLITSRYKDIGNLEAELKNYTAAETAYKKYLEYVVKNPSNEDYFSDQADGHSYLAELSFQQENWADAVKHYGQSVKLRQKLIDQRKVQSNLRDELNLWKSQANAHTRSGYSSYLLSDDRKAETSFAKAISARQSAIKAHLARPAEELELAVAYYNAAKYTDGKDDVYFQSASEIFDRLEKTMTIPTWYEAIRTDFSVLMKP